MVERRSKAITPNQILARRSIACLLGKPRGSALTSVIRRWCSILLVMKERIAGIFGQASNSTAWLIGKAKAVVLATGGIGGLYQHSTNPRHTTGDGHALALRAGVILQDMEFVQFVPFGVVESGLSGVLIPAEVMDHVPLVNSRGEEFLVSQFQSWGVTRPGEVNRYARDHGTRAIWQEVEEGRGHQGAVLLRLSSVAPEAWNIPEMVFFRKYILRGFPMDRDLHVAPLAHFTVGGISVSPQGETNLEGLFAAGEVTGGLHGANRLGGNALCEALVFGARVGLAAANYRSRVSFSNSADREAEHNVFRYESASSNSGTLEIGHLKNKLRGAVEKYLGPIRCRDGLSTFLEEASEMKTLKRDVAVRTSQDRWGYWELENMLMVSEAIARSAMAREESRGAHYRQDYPEPVAAFSSSHTFIYPGGVCQFLSSNAPTTDA